MKQRSIKSIYKEDFKRLNIPVLTVNINNVKTPLGVQDIQLIKS